MGRQVSRTWVMWFAGLYALAVLVIAYPAAAAEGPDTCPNATIRAQQHADFLPDCRAWERVSPTDKNGSDIYFAGGMVRTAPDGDSAAFVSNASFAGGAGAPIVSDYLAARGATGWTVQNITQPGAADALGAQLDIRFGYRWLSPDLTQGVFMRNDDPNIDRNLWTRDFATGVNRRLSSPSITPLDPLSQLFYDPAFGDADDDGRHVVLESVGQLTPDAPVPDGRPRAYESVDGQLRLVGVLPADEGGGVAPASLVGRGLGPDVQKNLRSGRAMSDDGSRVYFTVPMGSAVGVLDVPGEVYLRQNGESTTHVSASQRTDCAGDPTCGGDGVPDPVPDPDGPGLVRFMTASSDGSVAFLGSCRKLTDDATAECATQGYRDELYRYDVASGKLTDLTPMSVLGDATLGACIRGCGLLGTSKDGSFVYFTDQSGRHVAYLWHDGTVTEIGPAGTADGANFNPRLGSLNSQVSGDGRFLLWTNDMDDPPGLYLYDAQREATVCVSCGARQDGAPAESAPAAPTQLGVLSFRDYAPRSIDAAGKRVFFNTTAGLSPQDSNGRWDVYEYEIATGKTALLSGGSQNGNAYLGDVTPDGTSVFIVTDQGLSGGDDDGLRDLYVARVNGGHPEPSRGQLPCSGDGCQGIAPPLPAAPIAGSVTFVGTGDLSGSPAGTSPAAPSSVSVARLRSITGSVATLKVKVPAAGGVRVSGSSVRDVTKKATRAATYSLRVSLTTKAKASLKRHRTLKVAVKVAFRSTGGETASTRVTLTFKRPKGGR